MIPCPFPDVVCPTKAESVGALAAHLHDAHGIMPMAHGGMSMARDAAVRAGVLPENARAQERVPAAPSMPAVHPSPEEPVMPRPCGYCKTVGHGRKDCLKRIEDANAKRGGAADVDVPVVRRADVPLADAKANAAGRAIDKAVKAAEKQKRRKGRAVTKMIRRLRKTAKPTKGPKGVSREFAPLAVVRERVSAAKERVAHCKEELARAEWLMDELLGVERTLSA